MKTEDLILLQSAWKKQAVKDASEWATLTTQDEKRLNDFRAGVARGWDECLSTMKLHELVNTGE